MPNLNLSGNWTLTSSKLPGKKVPAELPGDNYKALIAAGICPDPYFGKNELDVQKFRFYDWTFSRKFDVPKSILAMDAIFLEMSMVDTFCTIEINGTKVLDGFSAFVEYRKDVKPFLKQRGNTIAIYIRPIDEEAAKLAEKRGAYCHSRDCKVPHLNQVRKPICSGGWDWGITMATCGVYAPIVLRAVNGCRISDVKFAQEHSKGKVVVVVNGILEAVKDGSTDVTFQFNGETRTQRIAHKAGETISVKETFTVKNPKLWWPNGYGEQPLYTAVVSTESDSLTRSIGLRTLKVINEKDDIGASMFFRVNGVDIFAKGADWIPCDAIPGRQTFERFDNLLRTSRDANMNMIRVWGGGQYEKDVFYELCDKYGILVWQDMMFSCSLYPSTDDFLDEVREELRYQIRRLAWHPCLAIWCGDNECLGACGWYPSVNRVNAVVNYDRLNRVLGKTIAELDNEHTFWPSSPCGGQNNFSDGWHNDTEGDMHYWEVWHGGKSFSDYYNVKPRFCSEFGYQSFPSAETVRTYCPADQENVFSPVMEHHQKCHIGNAPIISMFGNYFRMPSRFENFLVLSQTQQALAIKTGVEYWRTLRPRCMGTIFWQLNDNWPVASWSSVEYGGKWKQLQYHAKRFYSPVAVFMYHGKDGIYYIYGVNDTRAKVSGKLACEYWLPSGKKLNTVEYNVTLKAGESKLIQKFTAEECADYVSQCAFIKLSLRGEDADGNKIAHDNDFYFVPFKTMELEEANVSAAAQKAGDSFEITVSTDKPALFVTLDVPGIQGHFSDNSFLLLPGEPRKISFLPEASCTLAAFKKALSITNLRETY